MIILGIDPGLAIVGYGVIESKNNNLTPLDYGTITTDASMPMPERLDRIFRGMNDLIEAFKPDLAAFEEIFFYKNIRTAIAVSQARGVVVLAAQRANLPLYEFTPMQIKLAAAGYGHAEKAQVQHMVKVLLNLKEIPKPDDAADALAIAICIANNVGPLVEQFRIK